MKLTLTDQERQALESFLGSHGNCMESGLIFDIDNSNGIGQAITVTCGCGEQQNITDYSAW